MLLGSSRQLIVSPGGAQSQRWSGPLSCQWPLPAAARRPNWRPSFAAGRPPAFSSHESPGSAGSRTTSAAGARRLHTRGCGRALCGQLGKLLRIAIEASEPVEQVVDAVKGLGMWVEHDGAPQRPSRVPSATLGPADRARSGLVPSGPAWTRSGQAITFTPGNPHGYWVSASERSPHFYAYYGRFGPISADWARDFHFVPNPCRGFGPFLHSLLLPLHEGKRPNTPPTRPLNGRFTCRASQRPQLIMGPPLAKKER